MEAGGGMKCVMVQVADPEGLHVRNCARIVAAAARLDAELSLFYGEKKARADHVLELMALEAPSGSRIEIYAEGKEQESAVNTIAQILSR